MHVSQLRQGLIMGGLLLIALWLMSLIWGLVGKARIAVSQAHDAQSQYESIEDRKSKLQASVVTLETELGRDAAIRTVFGVARPGEEVIVVVPSIVATSTPPQTWWQKVIGWF